MAPTLAIKVVIGMNIKNAGIFINPMLKGILVSKKDPEIKNPIEPKVAMMKPIAAALPIAFFIEYPKYFRTGTFITAPPIPIGAETNPDINPKIIFGKVLNFLLVFDLQFQYNTVSLILRFSFFNLTF